MEKSNSNHPGSGFPCSKDSDKNCGKGGRTLYVSDLDGTLLQPDAWLSKETVELLNQSIADGKLFTVATARTPATVAPILRDVNLRLPAIVMTGAALWSPCGERPGLPSSKESSCERESSSVLFSEGGDFLSGGERPRRSHELGCYYHPRFMARAAAENILEIYRASQTPTFVYTLNGDMIDIYQVGGPLTDLQRQFMAERIHNPFKRFHVDPSGRETLPPDPGRIILMYAMLPDARAARLYETTSKLPGIRAQYYHDIYGPEVGILEAFSADATKANAIKELARSIGADRTVCFGDNINDLPMMRHADLAVAVENALPEVKEAADIVIGPNTADSVARFIFEDTEPDNG